MEIKETLKLFRGLISRTDKKSEIKIYNCFIRILMSLGEKDLNEEDWQLIREKLTAMNLKADMVNKKRYYKQKLDDIKSFLKDEFSFTSERYFTERGMITGIILGSGIGLTFGVAADPAAGISIGLSIGTGVGMVLGMGYGAKKDAEAKRMGLVV